MATYVETFRGSVRSALTDHQLRFFKEVDGWLLTIVLALMAFGLVMVWSASEGIGYALYGDPSYYFIRQAAFMVVGAAGMLICARIDYHRWRTWTKPIVLGTLVLLLLVLLPRFGSQVAGARRWFAIGSFTVQPSAVAALMVILALSRWLVDRGTGIRNLRTVRDYMVLLGALLILVVLERDLGSTIVLAAVGLSLFFLAGARWRHIVLVGLSMFVFGMGLVLAESYRSARLAVFLNPFSDPLNAGFQAVQSLLALGSGGVTGVGLGHSIQKYEWLPAAHTDFIFSIIGEELGLIGTLGVVFAFAVLVWRGVRASLFAPDSYGALVAGGISAWIGVQAFLNIATVTGLVPTTGIPLPFISYGGSALTVTLVGVGILFNISAQGRRQGVSRAHIDRGGRDGRSSDSSARVGARA
jgi:cell division protein FtsW